MMRQLFLILLLAVTILADNKPTLRRRLRTGGQASKTAEEIVKQAASDVSVFNDATSYQSMALAWVENNSIRMSEARILQRYALACVYYATYKVATTWTQASDETLTGWKSTAGWLAANSDECDGSWLGVLCNSSSQVVALRLDSNKLSGSFPTEVTLLKSSLVELDLTNNNLYNNGAGWLGDLTNLEVLLIGRNAIIDQGLPLKWKNLSKLRSLDVGYCLFSGAIDGNFFNAFPNLEYLDIGGNTFNGPIPSSIASLSSLKYLYMEYSDLTGSLNPVLKSGLPKLEEFWCDDNPKLSGSIATEVGQLTTLKSLSLVNCNLSGGIPSQMGDLVKMEQLWLSENGLNGSIPAQLGSLTKMDRFHIHDNELQGSMPSALCSSPAILKLGGDCNNCQANCCTCCGSQCSDV